MRTAVDLQHRTYRVWAGMKARCQNKNNPNYRLWGARGITVCNEWQTYAGFIADMGYAPDGLTIDRIDNDGNYEPGNCRWANRKEQARNTRKAIRISVAGSGDVVLADFAEKCGVKSTTLTARIRRGWSPLDALMYPVSAGARISTLIEFKGESLGLTQWAKKLGIPKGTLKSRLSRGWTLERALAYV